MIRKVLACCLSSQGRKGDAAAKAVPVVSVVKPAVVAESAPPATASEELVASEEDDEYVQILQLVHGMLEQPLLHMVYERLEARVPGSDFAAALSEELKKLASYPITQQLIEIITAGVSAERVARAQELCVELARQIVENAERACPPAEQTPAKPRSDLFSDAASAAHSLHGDAAQVDLSDPAKVEELLSDIARPSEDQLPPPSEHGVVVEDITDLASPTLDVEASLSSTPTSSSSSDGCSSSDPTYSTTTEDEEAERPLSTEGENTHEDAEAECSPTLLASAPAALFPAESQEEVSEAPLESEDVVEAVPDAVLESAEALVADEQPISPSPTSEESPESTDGSDAPAPRAPPPSLSGDELASDEATKPASEPVAATEVDAQAAEEASAEEASHDADAAEAAVEEATEDDMVASPAEEVVVAEEVEAQEVVAEEVVVDEVVADEVVADEVVAVEVVAEEVVAPKVVAEEVVADEVVADEVVADKVVADEVVADEVVAEKVVSDEVVSDEVVAEEVVAGEAIAAEVVAAEVAAEEVVAEEAVAAVVGELAAPALSEEGDAVLTEDQPVCAEQLAEDPSVVESEACEIGAPLPSSLDDSDNTSSIGSASASTSETGSSEPSTSCEAVASCDSEFVAAPPTPADAAVVDSQAKQHAGIEAAVASTRRASSNASEAVVKIPCRLITEPEAVAEAVVEVVAAVPEATVAAEDAAVE